MDITDAERKGIAKAIQHLRDHGNIVIADHLEREFLLPSGYEVKAAEIGTLYQVLDGDRAADENGFPHLVGKGWADSIFKTLYDAQIYAAKWLNVPPENMKTVRPDAPFDYSGYGDMLEIRTIPVKGPKV